MSSQFIQLLVLAGVAVFLILKLRSILGTRDGFEKPPVPLEPIRSQNRPDLAVIEGGKDLDIADHVPDGSASAIALAAMKKAEPSFAVGPFLQGARGAYEMILTAFDKGEMDGIRPFLSDEVAASFVQVINTREREGLTVESTFIGLKEMALQEATFDAASGTGEITIRFVAELTTAVRNKAGQIVEGDAKSIKRQRDIWTFGRQMGAKDPNWQLVATGD
ncbi:MAG: Tim44/TimA family putative adaptor protein [Paracoccaceae bacterium]